MMKKISEAKLTKMISSHLKRMGVFYWKTSDRYTSGIPDFVGCHCGLFFAIEVKASGKKSRDIQTYILDSIKRNGGATLVTDDFSLYLKFIEAIKDICLNKN